MFNIKYIDKVIEELKDSSNLLDNDQISTFVEELECDSFIFVSGAGRSGLMVKAFANRLLHIGKSVSVVGEITCPHTNENDLIVFCSGSGETPSLISQAEIAKKGKLRIALVTSSPESTLAKLADLKIIIQAPSKTISGESVQPMGTLFEQLSLLAFDSIVMVLMDKMSETNSSMINRHANLE